MTEITNKTIFEQISWNVRIIFDRDVAKKNYENKVGMSSY